MGPHCVAPGCALGDEPSLQDIFEADRNSGGRRMCTLSFIPRKQGYMLAMNRDERIARGAGLSPEIFGCDGESAIIPAMEQVGHGLRLTKAVSPSRY